MTDPSTVGLYAAGSITAGLVGVLAGVNGEAAVGALFGALVYLTTTDEMPVWHRVILFMASLVMGYLFAPAVAGVEVWGVHPFAFPGPAAFSAALLLVTVSMAALRLKRAAGKDDAAGGPL
jgi:hypothetical protein